MDPAAPAVSPDDLISVGRRAWWLRQLLLVAAAVAFLGVLAQAEQVYLLDGLESGSVDPFQDSGRLQAADDRANFVHLLALPALIAAAVMWIAWFARLYSNLHRRGAQPLRHGPRWAVFAWIVPVLNLFRPKQMVNDTWWATGPAGKDTPLPPLLRAWWITFLLSGVVVRFAIRPGEGAETIADFRSEAVRILVSDGLDVAAAVLAVLVVRRLTVRHDVWAGIAPPPDGGGPGEVTR